MTRGERAAARFVRELVPGSVAAAVRKLRHPGFLRVLAACRIELGLTAPRSGGPAQRLIKAFPAEQRATLTSLLGEVLDEIYDERRVSDRAAFLAGMSVGKLLARSCASRKQRR